MRRACALSLLALAGCAGESDERPAPKRTPNEGVIRGWNAALNASRYDEAADFFARGAVVDQGTPISLPNHRAAVAFNRSLPCRSTVTEVREEGRTTVAAFKLRVGPGGTRRGCDETVRVRFTIRKGKFAVFEQLPEPDAPRGEPA